MTSSRLPDVVGRLVVRAAGDTPAVRLEARARLATARIRPRGSSAHEVLVVRSLTWVPGAGGQDDLGPHLDALRRTAVPLDGRPVPAGAAAVVATDLAQLLAQYVVDGHDGVLASRWWWRELAARFPRATAATVLAAYPSEAPHTVVELAARRRLDVLEASPEDDVRDLAVALAAAYAAPRLVSLLEAVDADRRAVAARATADAPRGASAAGRVAPLELMTVVAAQLASDPVRARHAEFARFVEVLGAGPAPVVPPTGSADASALRRARGDAARGSQVRSRDDEVRSGRSALDESVAEVGATYAEGPTGSEAAAPQGLPSADRGHPAAGSSEGIVRPATDAERPASPGDDTPTFPQHDDDVAEAMDPVVRPPGVHTALGGVFFLVGAATTLGVPDVFDDWELPGSLGAWAAVDALARSLLPDEPACRDDLVWDVLEELGGGPQFGRTVEPPHEVRLPATWLDLCPAQVPPIGQTLASASSGGLRAWLRLVRPRFAGWLAAQLSVPAVEVSSVLLRHPAHVRHDRTHVDVAFPLSAASVVVRRSGLDRDPGWVPAFGRVVGYAFDDVAYTGEQS